jgi:hypothetical protein
VSHLSLHRRSLLLDLPTRGGSIGLDSLAAI